MTRAPRVSLVVPVHHCTGSLRIALDQLGQFLDAAGGRCELVLVDDRGSDADASAMLDAFARRACVRLLRNDRNYGKGYSVKRGMLAATAQYRVFTDADLAYPLDQVWKIVDALAGGADVAVACRVLPASQYIMNAGYLRYIFTRHVMSRAFNRLVRLTLVPGVLDTQAGLKGFTAAAAQDVFSRVSIPGFGFDVESLYVARSRNLRIAQVPVIFRYSDEPSTVRFVKDGARMAGDLARIRWRGLKGVYTAAGS